MNAIVPAGGSADPEQPLYEITHGKPKALVEICGKPMVQWVLDALGKCSAIERVLVIGLPPDTDLACAHPLAVLPDHGGLLANIMAGAQEVARLDPQATHTLLCSGDLPALRVEMVEWLLDQVKDLDQDIYYSVVERGTMESVFPASRRTYVPMKDVEVCGGDLHCFRLAAANEENSLIKRLIAARKNPLQQASMIGFSTLFWLVLRRLSLSDVETAVSQRLRLRGRVLISPFPETGMDVDKPFQYELVREYLERNASKAQPF